MGHVTRDYTGIRHRTCQLNTPFQDSSWPIIRDFLIRLCESAERFIIALSVSHGLVSPFRSFLRILKHLKVVGVNRTQYLIISPNSFPSYTSRELLLRERTARRMLQHCRRKGINLSLLQPNTPCYVSEPELDSLHSRLERLSVAP